VIVVPTEIMKFNGVARCARFSHRAKNFLQGNDSPLEYRFRCKIIMAKHIPYLDGWRGLAIVCLLIGHFFPVRGLNFGTVGVGLFFVLSGLLMAQVLFVQRTDFRTFYRRRVARVFPSVAVYVVTVTIVFLLVGHRVVWAEVLSAVTFTNNYFVIEKWAMPFGHIWSLSVEEHSYVILSLAAYWCRLRGGRELTAVMLIVIVILVAIAIYSLVPHADNLNYSLRTEVASFGIFASGLLALSSARLKTHMTSWWIAPMALIVGILAHWWSVPTPLRLTVGAGAFALAVNTISSAPRWFILALEFSWLRRLGMYSFSLYLWQQPFYQLSRHFGLSPFLGVTFSLVAGWIAFYLIENPARSYLNRQWGAKPTAAAVECKGDFPRIY
jgi:peptidoglycan/LPS O-acetylase OafA/YrhL